jgi:hypothetical protein
MAAATSLKKKKNKKKLTLSIDEKVIEQGKEFARGQGTSLSKLFEQFLKERILPTSEPLIIIEPDPEILALMGKPKVPLKPKTNREYYDEYYLGRRARYLENSKSEEE